MANLSNLNIDPNIEENEGVFKVIPPGEYKAVMIADDLRATKNGKGKILITKNQIIEGEHAGHVLTDRLNVQNDSVVCQNIGLGTIKRLCRLTDVDFPPPDTSYIYGKPFMITVAVEEFKSNTSEKMLKSNKIVAYNQVEATSKPLTSAVNKKNPW